MATLEQQIAWLDVAVEDAQVVGVLEGFGGLDAEAGGRLEVFAMIGGAECGEVGVGGSGVGE